jgi:hypothetical protein
MFPPLKLKEMRRLTNRELQAKRRNKTTSGEILKTFGVFLLMTRFEFDERASLGATNQHKYIPSPAFCKTGMSKRRCDDLQKCVLYSEQPAERPASMSSEL